MSVIARAGLALGIVASLCACPEEAGGPPVVSPSPSPSVTAEPVTSTRTIELTSPSPSGSDAPSPSAEASGPPCADVPWAGQPRCVHAGHVFASATVRGVRNPSLARATASNRARAALLGGKAGTLNGSTIVQVTPCGDGLWALAQVDAADLGGVELPECAFTPPAE